MQLLFVVSHKQGQSQRKINAYAILSEYQNINDDKKSSSEKFAIEEKETS